MIRMLRLNDFEDNNMTILNMIYVSLNEAIEGV